MTADFLQILCTLFFCSLVVSIEAEKKYSEIIKFDLHEYNTLWEIYNSTNGDYWTWPNIQGDNWVFNDYYKNNPCNSLWKGLYCNPYSIDGTYHIFSLQLSGYNLTGTLPPIISNFTNLLFFIMSENNIGGSPPQIIGSPGLQTYNMSFNNFTGTIPDTWHGCDSLRFFYLSHNSLSGPIPRSLYTLPNLQFISFYNNSLGGEISGDIGSMSEIVSINLGYNKFQGQVPDEIIRLEKLEQLQLQYNQLEGHLPSLPKGLHAVRLMGNFLAGNIPSCLCNSHNLSLLQLYNNSLTGTIPTCLSNLRYLSVVQLQCNFLSGTLENLFDPAIHTQLKVLDIGDNAISGTFPAEVFQLPSLYSISAAKNCFHGSLPDTICSQQVSQLQTLSMDGMHASPKCSSKLWDPWHLTQGYFSQLMIGKLPECVWSLTNISTLHLAGNGFSGTIPSDVAISPTLKDVSLNHNEFGGTIPEGLLKASLYNLDLSYNKFRGSIEELSGMEFSTQPDENGATLNLIINRLSGKLSASMQGAYGINVLNGNIFTCSDDALPEHDPSSKNYFCGSSEYNNALFVYSFVNGIAVFIPLLLLLLFHLIKPSSRWTSKWIERFQKAFKAVQYVNQYCISAQRNLLNNTLDDSQSSQMALQLSKCENILQYLSSLSLIRRLSAFIACYSMIILLPTYMAFYSAGDNKYSSFNQRYGWVTTSAFLSGNLPSLVLFVLLAIMLLMFLLVIILHYNMHTWLHKTRLSRLLKRATFTANSLKETFRPSMSNTTRPSLIEKMIGVEVFSSYAKVNSDDVEVSNIESAVEEQAKVPLLHSNDSPSQSTPPSCRDSLNQEHSSNSNNGSSRGTLISLESGEMKAAIASEEFWSRARYFIVFLTVFCINITVSITINASYLLVQNSNSISAQGKICIQVLMAGFKIFWNMIPIRLLISNLPYDKHSAKLHVILLLTNTIISPCLATAFSDSSCFADFFFGSPTICSAYSLELCEEFGQSYDGGLYYTECTQYQDSQYVTEFTPSFIYYYSCGSKLLTAYIPVFIYSYTILLVFAPMVYFTLAALKTKSTPLWILKLVDGVARPNDRGKIFFNNLIRGNAMQAMLAQHLVVLLTFGVNSPLLAVVMMFAIAIDTFMWQLIIVRFIKYDNHGTPLSPLYRPIEQETEWKTYSCEEESDLLLFGGTSVYTKQVSLMGEEEMQRLYELHAVVGNSWLGLRNTMWLAFDCAIFFYCSILFDITGSVSGWKAAFWVVIAWVCYMVILRVFLVDGIVHLYALLCKPKNSTNTQEQLL